MCSKCHQVYSIFIYINRNFPYSLCTISKDEYAVLFPDVADLLHMLHRTNLIVCIHNRDKDCSWPDSSFQFLEIYQSVSFYLEISNLATKFFYVLAGIQYSFVFCSSSNDMISFAGIHFINPFYSQVVSFCSTTGKNDFFRISSNQFCYLLTCIIYRFFRFPAKRMVTAGSIAKMVQKIRRHGLKHTWIHWSRGVVI